jgi:hypothetical protein
VHATKSGRKALSGHLAALQQLIDKVADDKERR